LVLTCYNLVSTPISTLDLLLIFAFTLTIGVGLSHMLSRFMITAGWLRMSLARLAPRVFAASVITGVIYAMLFASMLDLFVKGVERILVRPYNDIFALAVTMILLSMIWSAAYLVYNYVRNYEREEVKNLKLQATKNEMELNILRSQLNPHFMFNAMNSIRALINEDPELAKTAVTKLSNILRSTLLAGKKQFVTLNEELTIVKDHVALEKIRYEERLNVEYDLDKSVLSRRVPPLIVQTLVENAIKHGISKLKEGGRLYLAATAEGEGVKITIENSGQYDPNASRDTGIGLENTRRRLGILYGKAGRLEIANKDASTVQSVLIIPPPNTHRP